MALTCPNCGNARNFLVKTLQMHVVLLDDSRVEVSEESKPGVIAPERMSCVEIVSTTTVPSARLCTAAFTSSSASAIATAGGRSTSSPASAL